MSGGLLLQGLATVACAELTAVALAAAASLCPAASLQQPLTLLNKCLDALLQRQAAVMHVHSAQGSAQGSAQLSGQVTA